MQLIETFFFFHKILLQAGANAALHSEALGKSPIHFAATKSDNRALGLLFSQAGNKADVNAVMRTDARTALHVCVMKKNLKGVSLLLKQPGVEVRVSRLR